MSLEVRDSAVTERADVVLPVAPPAEKAGTFVSWEGRGRAFDQVLHGSLAMPDSRVLSMLAAELDVRLSLDTVDAVRRELAEFEPWEGARVAAPDVPASAPPEPGPGSAALATWRLLLDAGRGQDGEPHLAGTAHPSVARVSAATAGAVGVAAGGSLRVSTEHGSVELPVEVTEMPDAVVWLPGNSVGSAVHRDLRVGHGAIVGLSAGGAA